MMPKPSLLIVSNGLISYQDGLTLHPDLFVWQKALGQYKQGWFSSQAHNPLSMYAALNDHVQPALLLVEKLALKPAKQYWIASPYHAQLTRDSVRIMPEAMLPWCAEDAQWTCELLNPLLSEEGMQLHSIGSALLLSCEHVMDAKSVSFAEIAGKSLPNSHPLGKDSGYLMRLMSEVQMFLNQNSAPHRLERGEGGIHGLWLWGRLDEQPKDHRMMPAATVNPFLQSLVDGKDARLIMTEAEDVQKLVRKSLPKHILLMADDKAVLLKRRIWPSFSTLNLLPKQLRNEADLWPVLQNIL